MVEDEDIRKRNVSDKARKNLRLRGEAKQPRWIKGGNGAHWAGCEAVHYDCFIACLEAEQREEEAAEGNSETDRCQPEDPSGCGGK